MFDKNKFEAKVIEGIDAGVFIVDEECREVLKKIAKRFADSIDGFDFYKEKGVRLELFKPMALFVDFLQIAACVMCDDLTVEQTHKKYGNTGLSLKALKDIYVHVRSVMQMKTCLDFLKKQLFEDETEE